MKNRKKLLFVGIFATLLLVLTGSLMLGRTETAYANTFDEDSVQNEIRDGYTVNDVRRILEKKSGFRELEVFNEDGTMQKIQVPFNPNSGQASRSSPQTTRSTFNDSKIVDSQRDDSESIVITIMGDGFTDTQQGDFINAATDAVDFMIGNPAKNIPGFHPFNLFREYFTVYAIEVISPQSGVSRDERPNNNTKKTTCKTKLLDLLSLWLLVIIRIINTLHIHFTVIDFIC